MVKVEVATAAPVECTAYTDAKDNCYIWVRVNAWEHRCRIEPLEPLKTLKTLLPMPMQQLLLVAHTRLSPARQRLKLTSSV